LVWTEVAFDKEPIKLKVYLVGDGNFPVACYDSRACCRELASICG
jgi:hypothetical protein